MSHTRKTAPRTKPTRTMTRRPTPPSARVERRPTPPAFRPPLSGNGHDHGYESECVSEQPAECLCTVSVTGPRESRAATHNARAFVSGQGFVLVSRLRSAPCGTPRRADSAFALPARGGGALYGIPPSSASLRGP